MRIRRSVLAVALLAGLAAPAGAQSMDINSIISGIGGADFQAAVRRIDSAPAVRVVRLSTLAGAEQASDRLDEVLAKRPREIAYLHSSIILNPIALTALRNAGAEIDEVASLYMAGDSGAVLYVDDL